MNKRIIPSIFAFALLAATSIAEDPGRQKLFDGKTLEGWSGNPEFWSVEDGAITGRTTKDKPTKGNTFCTWQGGEPADFVLEFEFRIKSGNSGVQIRSTKMDKDKGWRIKGYQADFDFKGNWTGTLYGEKYRGVLAKRGEKSVLKGMVKKENGKGLKLDRSVESIGDFKQMRKHVRAYPEWNRYRVAASGKTIRLFVNDTQTSVCTDEHDEQRVNAGVIALQLHAGPPMEVQFREIYLTQHSAGK